MKKNKLLILIIIFIAGFSLLKSGYFSMHDDLHIIRLHQMEKCFHDGQIPCRWTPDMGFGYGLPLFNYYSPLVYYLGMFLRLFGLNFVLITKLLFLSAIVISGLGMYFLAKEFSDKLEAILATALFVLGPYRAVQIYVRGALAECWAVSLLPLIFLFTYKYIKSEKFNYFLLSTLFIFFFFLSHNILLVLSGPIIAVWVAGLIINERAYHLIKNCLLIIVLAFGLAAFFLIPAFCERDLIAVKKLTSGYFNFRSHFVSLRQMFLSRDWGYGSSGPGVNDGLSLQIGWPHWLLGILGIFFGWPYWFFGILGLICSFMMHARSIFIWKMFPILSFVQFPWRFLGLVTFLFSLSALGVVSKIKSKILKKLAVLTMILLTIGLNFSYFSPKEHYPGLTEHEKLSNEQWLVQIKGSINDYLPKKVKTIPQVQGDKPEVVQNEAKIQDFRQKSDYFWFRIESLGDGSVKVQVPIFDFPHWQVLIDRKEVSHEVDNESGVIQIAVPEGQHMVEGWFKNTRIRNLANLITIFSLFSLLSIIVIKLNGEEENEKD